ncbi:MAG: EscU/YscU/HrcU family type III secretion system export apparatus switch protein [Defluviitaleaceae bacterium]|nr:EscU/YscU/HrcU family type III secretion system export apparatus switch protein [Defluviitaleaceae bacterium]
MDQNSNNLNAEGLKKRMKAVAIKYDPTEIAPKVIAKGVGTIAERIVERGQDSDVPIYKDAKLTEDLTRLELGEFIPPELYDVIAQVLIFISDLDKLEGYRINAE